jgi:hypothetical protein
MTGMGLVSRVRRRIGKWGFAAAADLLLSMAGSDETQAKSSKPRAKKNGARN